jgi:prepilin-type N-terminal cleavage/methylation domain-containing protein
MNFQKKQKGFTFIELMIAIFIFALMMMAVAGIFSSSIGGYQKARAVQKNLEDAQFIMNQIAKILRTSSVVDNTSTSSIVVFDYSQGKCFRYTFDVNKIKFGKTDAPDPPVPLASPSPQRELFEKNPITWCNSNKPNASTPMAALDVTGKFNAFPSYPGSGNNGFLGRVTISMKVCSNVGCTSDKANIQTSVSLRDYYQAGI